VGEEEAIMAMDIVDMALVKVGILKEKYVDGFLHIGDMVFGILPIKNAL